MFPTRVLEIHENSEVRIEVRNMLDTAWLLPHDIVDVAICVQSDDRKELSLSFPGDFPKLILQVRGRKSNLKMETMKR